MDSSKLEAVFEKALEKPAPPEFLDAEQHRYYLVPNEGIALASKLEKLRDAGVRVLDQKLRYGSWWFVKTMRPR